MKSLLSCGHHGTEKTNFVDQIQMSPKINEAASYYNRPVGEDEDGQIVDRLLIPKRVDVQFVLQTGFELVFYSDKKYIVAKSATHVLL